MNNIDFPVFDDNETCAQYIKRLELYEINKNKNKYGIILNFLNDCMNNYNRKYKSITEFKNISYKYIYYNQKKFNIIMDKYVNLIVSVFKINLQEFENTNFLLFLKRILLEINYNLVSKTINNEIYYSIIMKKSKYFSDKD